MLRACTRAESRTAPAKITILSNIRPVLTFPYGTSEILMNELFSGSCQEHAVSGFSDEVDILFLAPQNHTNSSLVPPIGNGLASTYLSATH